MPKTRPYLDNSFLELDNNTAERAMKPVAIGRKNWMFAGSQRGGNSMAIAFTLINRWMHFGVNLCDLHSVPFAEKGNPKLTQPEIIVVALYFVNLLCLSEAITGDSS